VTLIVFEESSGRPSITPGTYFRMQLLGYFEGIDSERGIAWRAADRGILPRAARGGTYENEGRPHEPRAPRRLFLDEPEPGKSLVTSACSVDR
jgi:hypothetical protein